MKKAIVLLIAALVICAGISAADIQIGVMQNLINTSFLFDTEMDHFGVETAVGLPVVPLTISGIEALFKGNGDDSSESSAIARGEGDEEESDDMGFVVPAGAMANIYFKVYRGSKFSFRLGLQGDIIGLFGPDYIWTMAFTGPSLGFNFKFNDSFAMNFTSAIPFAMFLPESIAKYTYFYYTSSDENVLGNIFLAIYGSIGAIGCQLARLSFKWTV
ncbi:MAG: hypothetical protein J5800_07050 [Spirochaetales bacterium]|nr:hypothetical protein [Spirochaetales bacterium]MBR4426598.1 hypothetical protein [Spirochaetales bacterium]